MLAGSHCVPVLLPAAERFIFASASASYLRWEATLSAWQKSSCGSRAIQGWPSVHLAHARSSRSTTMASRSPKRAISV